MFITSFGLKRPVTVFMIFAAVLILGIISFANLNIDLFPDMSFPIVYVITSYQGAGPSEIESMVTKPLEKVISTVPNLKNITSSSYGEVSGIGVELETGTDVDRAANNIREKIDLVRSILPNAVSDPIIFKIDPSMIPVAVIGLSSTTLDLKQLRALALDEISPRFERVEGVAAASIYGGRDREIQVRINRAALEARHLSIQQVQGAIQTANLNQPGGRLVTKQYDFLVRTTGQFDSVAQIGKIIIGADPLTGAQIFLRDIAAIEDSYAEKTSSLPINGREGVVVQLQKASGSNTVKVAANVRKALEEVKQGLPPGVKATLIMDLSTYIQESIDNVKRSTVEGGLLAIFIILLFLANFRSTAIIAIAIPFSLITAFSMMYFGNMTLNIATMGGLALGVGRLVDDSIVVLENIYRHMKDGEAPLEASLKGTSEVGMAVIASTITTIIVFLPIVFVQGFAGIIFRPMAYTVSFSLFASLMISLILLPVLTNRFLRVESNRPGHWLERWNTTTEGWQERLNGSYYQLLKWALHHKTIVIVLVVLLLFSAMLPMVFVGKEFIPNSDSGEVNVTIKLPVGSKLEETAAVADQVYKAFKEIAPNDLVNCYARIGLEGKGMSALAAVFSGVSGSNAAAMQITLTKVSKRDRSTDQIIELVRRKVNRIPDAQIFIESSSMMAHGASFGASAPIVVEIYGYDPVIARQLAANIQKVVAETPHTVEIRNSLELGSPELQIRVNSEKAASLGLSVAQIAAVINTEIGGSTASLYRDPELGKEYDISVRFAKSDRQTLNDLERVIITTPAGQQIPLNNVAQIVKAIGPVKIDHKNQQRLVTVTAQVYGAAPGTVAEQVQKNIAKKISIPSGFFYKMGGSLKDQQESFLNLLFALLLAVLLVYMVLAAQFESLVDPFIIMFSVPLGLVGVAWGLFLSGHTLSVVSLLGVIMMSGIVVSNGILLVDYSNQLRKRGYELYEAVALAGRTRLRPVLMTTLTTIIGLMPMALGLGEGAELQSPMAVTVVSGLAFSTVITLVFIPTLYVVVETYLHRRKSKKAAA